MQIAATHFLPLTLVRRLRMLPAPGKVLVHAGQKVNAQDVIAETRLMGQHAIVDVRRALRLKTVEEAEKLIERQVGESIQKEDILAQSKGFFAHVLRAPVDGEIKSIQSGKVLIEAPGAMVKMQAGFAGIVVDVTANLGAAIETTGALAQGVWGNDRFDQGLLLVAASKPDEPLTKEKIDVSMRGAVVMGGPCSQADVLRLAAELPLRGLILSSLSADLLPLASSMPYPLVIIEGFGSIPYNQAAFDLLSTNDRRDACLKASSRNTYSGERPEVIIPLPANAEIPSVLTDFKPGRRVRILGMPLTPKIGAIVKVRSGQTRLPNGLSAACAEVRVENNTILVPLVNLDVLE